MFSVNETDAGIHFTFSSNMQSVDRVIGECKEYMKQHNSGNISKFNQVVREMLINAVEHGNKNIITHMVKCAIEHLKSSHFKITVEDEGEGFDFRKIDTNVSGDPAQIRNRGFALINALCDQIDFNKKGNAVIVYITLPREARFETVTEGDWQVIRPSIDITAGIAENFRVLLLQLLEQHHTHFRFDLKNVEDIDSMGLSVLICFANMLIKNGNDWKIEIINANKDILNLFFMTQMNKTFDIV